MVQPLTTPTSQISINSFDRNQSLLSRLAEQLSSGFRVNRASDDAAALAVGARLAADTRATNAVQTNIGLGQSTLQVSDGALSQQQDLLVRTNTLAVQAGSSFLSDQDRKNLNSEFQALVAEFDRIGGDTSIFGRNTLAGPGSSDVTVRVGTGIVPGQDNVDIAIDESTADTVTGQKIDLATYTETGDTLSLSSLDISTQDGADQANYALSSVIDQVIANRVGVGAAFNRLEAAEDVNATTELNYEAARSNLLDLDFLRGVTSFGNARNLGVFGIETLNLQNQLRGSILNLYS